MDIHHTLLLARSRYVYDCCINTDSSRIHQNSDAVVSFHISRYGEASTLGELIRISRLKKDWYGKDLASQINVVPMTIVKWENGHSTPSRDYLIRLQKHLKLAPKDIATYLGEVT